MKESKWLRKKKELAVVLFLMLLFLQCFMMGDVAYGETDTTKVGEWLFNEGSGTTVEDTSEGNNDGIIYGATFLEGKRGSALSFDGNDYVEIPHQSNLSPRTALSIEAWINPISNIKYQKVIYKSKASNTDYSIFLGGNRNIAFSFKTGNIAMSAYSPANSVPSGTWTHVVGTYDGSRMKLYINAKLVNNMAVSNTINMHAEPLRIGGGENSTNNNFKGMVDDVYIYDRGLSAEEVRAHYLAEYTEPEPEIVKVTGVSLNKTELALTVGQTERLSATVTPSDAANKEISWASSNPAVATVDGAGNVRAVAAGTANVVVTTADGGYTATCKINITQIPTENPEPVVTNKMLSLVAGAGHSAIINTNGTVALWGDNIGTGYINASHQMSGLAGVIALSSLENTTLALKNDGTVWAWGNNYSGQLGDGTKTTRKEPVQVSGLTGIKAVAAGCNHSLALKDDGTVWSWGYNGYGQLGDGTTTSRSTPGQVKGLTNVVRIQAGRSHSIALKADGTVWGWGYNGGGHMADGTTINRLEPVQIRGLKDIVAISTEACHNFAIKADGTLWAWGVNRYGTIGDGTSGTSSHKYYVIQLPEMQGVVDVATGRYHTLFLKKDGTVWSCGNNGYGQLGIGNYTSQTRPVQVKGLPRIMGITCGERHSFAVSEDGAIYAWGANEKGQLGDGTTTTRVSPVIIDR